MAEHTMLIDGHRRTSSSGYVHGYSETEAGRLTEQAEAMAALIHEGTVYPPGSRVLEAGCGVGGQTARLLRSSPGAHVVAVDRDQRSLVRARTHIKAMSGHHRVRWCRSDLAALPFPDESFEHVFVCFVLEHVANTHRVLTELRRVLHPGGTLTVFEGDNGTLAFHPESPDACAVIENMILLQALAGGDAQYGRRLHPALAGAGFNAIRVEPRLVYADDANPTARPFIRDVYNPMIATLQDDAVAVGLGSQCQWKQGTADLARVAEPGGTFHLTFFKATATKAE